MKRLGAWVIKFQTHIKESLTTKIFLFLFLLFIVALAISYFLIALYLPISSDRRASRELFIQAEELVIKLRSLNEDESSTLFTDFLQETSAHLLLLDSSRSYVTDFAYGNNLLISDVSQIDSDSRKEYPFRFANTSKEYILVVVYNPRISTEIKSAVISSLPWIIVISLILSILMAFVFSYYVAQPVKRISNIAEHLANLDFSWYCTDIRSDEIGKLANSMNELSDKLHAALKDVKYRERRRMLFFSAVSHELKTPVATVIGQLEGMLAGVGIYKNRDKYLARSAKLLRSLDSFIREILSVSYLDMKDESLYEPVHLSEVTTYLARKYGLISEVEQGLFIYGDRKLLEKAVDNVIANAVVHSPKGAAITVRLIKRGNVAKFQVINAKSHIEQEDIPHLFEAFYRAGNQTGSGSGLGLYITGIILDSHKAVYKIENQGDTVVFDAAFQIIFTQTP